MNSSLWVKITKIMDGANRAGQGRVGDKRGRTLLARLAATYRGNAPADASDSFKLEVDFEAPPGVAVLFGPSGSGKTTTLRAIAGIVRPDAGHIAIGDQTLFDSGRAINIPIRDRRVGYVFQELALFPHLSVRRNVEFGITGVRNRDRRKRTEMLMAAMRIEHTADRYPSSISGGEGQRVALARALARGPRILLLDEPMSALDQPVKLEIINDLKRINRELRLPIVYVTHSREEAITLGEQVFVYHSGRIVARGEPVKVLGVPVSSSVARLTGIENLFSGRVVRSDVAAGIMTVEIADRVGVSRLDIPFAGLAPSFPVNVAVPSGDILLSREPLPVVSARNVFPGSVESIEDKGDRMLVLVGSGVIWRVSVTRQAAAELSLEAGVEVWLAIKTHSCFLLDTE